MAKVEVVNIISKKGDLIVVETEITELDIINAETFKLYAVAVIKDLEEQLGELDSIKERMVQIVALPTIKLDQVKFTSLLTEMRKVYSAWISGKEPQKASEEFPYEEALLSTFEKVYTVEDNSFFRMIMAMTTSVLNNSNVYETVKSPDQAKEKIKEMSSL